MRHTIKKAIVVFIFLATIVVFCVLFKSKTLISESMSVSTISISAVDEKGNRLNVTEKVDLVDMEHALCNTSCTLEIGYQPYHNTSDVRWEIEVVTNKEQFYILLGAINYKYTPSSCLWVRYQILDPSRILSLFETVHIFELNGISGTPIGSTAETVDSNIPEDKGLNSKIISLHIPTIEDILNNGYPTNKLGETYGPDIKDSDYIPDLILAKNNLGVLGYIRATELDPNPPKSPSDLDHYTPVEKVNMYLEDGLTIIGEFDIGK